MAPASRISGIRWCSRKRRTKRESNCRALAKSCDNNLTKDLKINVSDFIDTQGKVLLQYSRRKYGSKSKIFTGAKIASGCSIQCLAELAGSNVGKIDAANAQGNLRIFCSKDAEAASDEFGTSRGKCIVHEEVPEANREVATNETSEIVEIGKALASASGDSDLREILGEGEESCMASEDLVARNCSNSPATATFNSNKSLGDSATCKHDCISTGIGSTTTVEVDMSNTKMSHRDRSKKKRKVELQLEAQKFVKSPCEGLRPRRNKQDSVYALKINVPEMAEENSPTKKRKKPTESSIQDNQVLASSTSYGCNRECCRMRFRTKVELSSHNRNQCHHKECGKRFRSHKYVVLHQRVHDEERPLKCTWAGCTMSFKWAWARTEHLRLHTGERPYHCKIKGCGLTFRFVSDFSRHRRKTGHYIN